MPFVLMSSRPLSSVQFDLLQKFCLLATEVMANFRRHSIRHSLFLQTCLQFFCTAYGYKLPFNGAEPALG